METTEYTFKALAEFASHLGQQEFTETQVRLVSWLRENLDFGMSVRTLQTHAKALRAQGKLSIRYTGEGICYSLPDGVVQRCHVKETPTLDPEVFVISDTGYELLSGESDSGYYPGADSAREHARAMELVKGIDLDALQDSWRATGVAMSLY
jgi:hypothetical protein